MNAKTERFEMRFDSQTLQSIDEWRGEQRDFPSRAEAVRKLVGLGLVTHANKPFKLSDGEILTLWMLSELIKKLAPDADLDVAVLQSALLGGHHWALHWKMTGLLHGHADKPDSVEFVARVLGMWRSIEDAFKGLSSSEQKIVLEKTGRSAELQFPGFDGNHESELFGIASFLTRDMDRFSEFSDRSLNSHHPTVAIYSQMLERYEAMITNLVGRDLSADELVEIVGQLG